MNSKLPSYDALFGIDFKEGEAARSVYSPAAYLADLLQLIDDHFATADLDIRRSDLKEILLDGEHTFSEIPYLDVVTEVLENKVLGSPYVTLKEAKYPFNLPFNLHEERTQLYLDRFEVKGEEVYQLFAAHPESGAIARLSLGLAPRDGKRTRPRSRADGAGNRWFLPSPNHCGIEQCLHLSENDWNHRIRTARTALSKPQSS